MSRKRLGRLFGVALYVAFGVLYCHWEYGGPDAASLLDLARILAWPLLFGLSVIGWAFLIVVIVISALSLFFYVMD